MYATYKNTTIKYAIYEGVTETYPRWFRQAIVDHLLVDEFGFSMYGLSTLTEGYDVFIMNANRDIRRINMDIFDNNFITINNTVAISRDNTILDYCVFDGQDHSLPDWVIEVFQEGIIARQYGTYMFYDENGELPLDPKFILVRNGYAVKAMSEEDFTNKFYIVPKLSI